MTQSGYHHIGIILCSVCHAKRLCSSLRRWIAGTHRGTIHISAALLGKLRTIAFAIDFSRRNVNHALHTVSQSIFYEMGYSIDIGFHHLYRFPTEEIRTRIACRIYDVISPLSQLIIDRIHYHTIHALDNRLGDINLCKEERLIFPISRKLLPGTFLIATSRYHFVASGGILHQHIHYATTYQSRGTHHKNGLVTQTLQV